MVCLTIVLLSLTSISSSKTMSKSVITASNEGSLASGGTRWILSASNKRSSVFFGVLLFSLFDIPGSQGSSCRSRCCLYPVGHHHLSFWEDRRLFRPTDWARWVSRISSRAQRKTMAFSCLAITSRARVHRGLLTPLAGELCAELALQVAGLELGCVRVLFGRDDWCVSLGRVMFALFWRCSRVDMERGLNP